MCLMTFTLVYIGSLLPPQTDARALNLEPRAATLLFLSVHSPCGRHLPESYVELKTS